MVTSMTTSWMHISVDSPFSIHNIPFGVISSEDNPTHRPGVVIGDYVLDLAIFTANSGFSHLACIQSHLNVFAQKTLNDFAALGRPIHREVRNYLRLVFQHNGPYASVLETNATLQILALLPLSTIQNHLPLQIGDYTDFYAGLNHAYNVGVLFRGKDNALQPNYKHIPIGYHGRASSVVVSGTPIHRPNGQILPDSVVTPKVPTFGPCKKLDIELELAAFVCIPTTLGQPVPASSAEEYIFGFTLMNDWSARDIQAWEYVPLGPFTSKNFGTTISPWVVLVDALEPFRAPSSLSTSIETLLPYLHQPNPNTMFDISLTVELRPSGLSEKYTIAKANSRDLLFSFAQMLAHHTVTGCNMRTGDLIGSGTISGCEPGTLGSLLEATKNGKEPLVLGEGLKRTFLEDGDEVIISGRAGVLGRYIGFGECNGIILPAPSV
ncbi:hypothetical protein TWF173_008869 [Orbilia oligospora]|nr:hypothetical protein TWF173_008869 [Orbilia oligospora]